MTDKRMIVVDCCRDCPCEDDCKKCQDSLDKNIPASCPLPKLPSTDMRTIKLFLKAAEKVGVSPTYLAAWLKSKGMEVSDD